MPTPTQWRVLRRDLLRSSSQVTHPCFQVITKKLHKDKLSLLYTE